MNTVYTLVLLLALVLGGCVTVADVEAVREVASAAVDAVHSVGLEVRLTRCDLIPNADLSMLQSCKEALGE